MVSTARPVSQDLLAFPHLLTPFDSTLTVFEDLLETQRQVFKVRGWLTDAEKKKKSDWEKGEPDYCLDAMFFGSVSWQSRFSEYRR